MHVAESVCIMTCRRSREGAWIEIPLFGKAGIYRLVAPVRERGLKCYHPITAYQLHQSLP